MKYATEIELGSKIKDKISGVEGIATSACFFLYGCTRIALQPVSTDGKHIEAFYVDEPQLELVDKPTKATKGKPNSKRHGARNDATRAATPTQG